jgi:type IV pilus assembly protein PilO
MPLADQLERFSKAPTQHKALGLLGITAFFSLTFYFMFYSDLVDQLKNLETQVATLEEEKTSYEEKIQKYDAFRAQVNQLLEEQKELVKVLPTESQMEDFLKQLKGQGELAGLNILTYQPTREKKQNFYAKIPVKMAIIGTFHQINQFFYSVGRLKRIVNIQDVTLGSGKVVELGVLLRASFVASTFRFLAPKKRQGPPQPRAGG